MRWEWLEEEPPNLPPPSYSLPVPRGAGEGGAGMLADCLEEATWAGQN